MHGLLTIGEVADQTRIPIATLRWYRSRGIGPASARVGRRVMYRQTDVDNWIDEQFGGLSGASSG